MAFADDVDGELAGVLLAVGGIALCCAPFAFGRTAELKRWERYEQGRREGRQDARTESQRGS
jgi:hypothetical protein